MFDLAWSEIALIVVVALVVIGPKDLPDAVRGAARGIGKLRRMAGQFQGHLDEVVREAKLEDVRDQIRDIRNFDVRGEIERAVDRDGTLRSTLREDPFRAPPPTPSDVVAPVAPAGEDFAPAPGAVAPREVAQLEAPPGEATAGAPPPGQPVSGADLLGSRPSEPMPFGAGTATREPRPAADAAAPDASPAGGARAAPEPVPAHVGSMHPAPPHPAQPGPRDRDA